MGILIITHHDKLLEHNVPDFTHVMLGGRIVETGGVELARELYTEGYDRIRAGYPEAAADEASNGRRAAAEQPVVALRTSYMTHFASELDAPREREIRDHGYRYSAEPTTHW